MEESGRNTWHYLCRTIYALTLIIMRLPYEFLDTVDHQSSLNPLSRFVFVN
jgi:hypothetical protein